MNIWKSPVFYFGVFLLVVVMTALAAPFIVNWNQYRDNIESYGRKITGRDVAVNGAISARLFPWPNLVLHDVSLGNPKGDTGAPVLSAEKISMQLNLSGLLAGDIFVESVEVDQPIITLTRIDAEHVNWVFQPEQSMRDSKLLDHVKLDKINIVNGTLNLQDKQHGFSTSLSDINTALSAPELLGPWRVQGQARHGDVPLNVSFTSNTFVAGAALKFGLRLEPQDGALPAAALEGEIQNLNLKGKFRVEPVQRDDGKASLDQQFKPLKMQSDIEANFDHVALDAIQITPADSHDNGTLIEGTAEARFDQGVKTTVKLKSPRLDLDSLMGDQSLRIWHAGGVMALLNGFMKEFPDKFDLVTSLDVAAISAAGQNLDNLRIRAAAEKEAIRITDFSANLPGRSRMKFDGIAFPGENAAELGGTLALESNDARALTNWLWPEGKADIAAWWTGSRGRLKAQSDVTWSGTRFGFQNLNYEMDGESGSAELAVQLGKLSAIDLKLKAKTLDLDNYLPRSSGSLSTRSIPFALLQSDTGFEKRLSLTANSLQLNGVEAQNVAVDLDSSLSGFEIKKFEIGSVEGATVKGQGLVLQGPDGPSGEIKATLAAENPRGFIRLLGLAKKGVDPIWTTGLGATNIQASLHVTPSANEPLVTFAVDGSSGPLQLNLSGDIHDLAKQENAALRFSTEITSANSSDIAALLGWSGVAPSSSAGRIQLTASGSQAAGFKSAFSSEIYGAKFTYDGTYKSTQKIPVLDGKLNLASADFSELGRVLAMPLEQVVAGPVSLSLTVEPKDGALQFTGLTGEIAGQHLSGKGSIDADGKLHADIALDELHLRDVLSTSFMSWRGKQAAMDESFAPLNRSFEREIWLHPALLKTGFGADLNEAVIGISSGLDGQQFSLAGRDKNAEPFKLDITLKPEQDGMIASGSLHVPIALEPFVKMTDGTKLATGIALLDGSFSGHGRSPMAVLTTLQGDTSYVLRDATLPQLSPKNFFDQLKDVKTTAELQSAFDVMLKPPGTSLMAQQLAIKVENGALRFDPLVMNSPEAELKITPSYDFSTGEFQTQIGIASIENKDLPPMLVAYTGLPGQLRQRSDVAAVANTLGFKLMSRDLAALEQAQKEQEKMAADEAVQQKQDEEKFAAFQAQRNELRLRQREQKVFAAQRLIDSERAKAVLDKALKEAEILKPSEIEKFLRMENAVP